jgi:hypothetical protein
MLHSGNNGVKQQQRLLFKNGGKARALGNALLWVVPMAGWRANSSMRSGYAARGAISSVAAAALSAFSGIPM